jgi:hypothetical protein
MVYAFPRKGKTANRVARVLILRNFRRELDIDTSLELPADVAGRERFPVGPWQFIIVPSNIQ